jgi:hypothetical protein
MQFHEGYKRKTGGAPIGIATPKGHKNPGPIVANDIKVRETAQELIEGQRKNRQAPRQFLALIDSIDLFAQIGVSICALLVSPGGVPLRLIHKSLSPGG